MAWCTPFHAVPVTEYIIGETGRTLATRIREHKYANQTNVKWYCKLTKWSDSKIIGIEEHLVKIFFLESIKIKSYKQNLNLDGGLTYWELII